jgi:glycosyltransferase involved in cell wall biosynthesis
MRILLVSFVSNNRHSGMGTWSHRVAAELAGLGHEPTLWFAEDFPRVRRLRRLSVLVFPVVLAWTLWRERKQYDVVIVHEPSGFWYGLLRRAGCGVPPLIAMCHNVESKYFRELREARGRGLSDLSWWSYIKTPLFRLWQSDGAIRSADHVLCLSRIDEHYIHGSLGVRPGRVTRLINGVDSAQFERRPLAVRGGARVLFVGGWLDVKGRHLLPAIWSRVCARFPEARLTVVGAGVAPEIVFADFDRATWPSLTVDRCVTDPAEMRELYLSHDLFLMPSLSEGSPLALLEAMAAGLPSVAARVGGIPDVIADGTEGLLFRAMDPGDAFDQLARILSDAGLRESLGRAARDRTAGLTWQETARGVERALAAVPRVPTGWAGAAG